MYIRFVSFVDQLNKYRQSKISNRNFLVFAAVFVGIFAGLAAALLKGITHHIQHFLQSDLHWQYKYYLYLLFPTIGILLSVIYVKRFIRKGKFEMGLTPLLYTISKKSSRVEAHNTYSQIITAAITVGFGGSTGLEAPIATSGAAIGSNVGRFLGLSYREITLLLACGAAAGIAGAFNSPIAGIVFAIEILLPEFSIPAFIPLLLSAATASVVARLFFKEQLFFLVTEGWELKALLFYVVLAVVIGLYSYYFTKMNKLIKGSFYKIKNPYYKIAVGGLILGLLVFLFPSLYGEGYLTINSLLKGDHTAIISNSIFSQFSDLPFVVIVFALVTVMFKSVATLVTLAAGGNGGTFAPSLIIGGMLGFIIAYTVNLLGIAELNVANFIVAGMAAALGSVMHAPLTGIFLIAEITGGYVLMVPLMITTAIAYFISRGVSQYSIYTKPLVDAGHLSHHEDKDTTVLNMMSLKSLIEKDQLILKDTDLLSDRIADILNSKRNVIPVVNESKVFQGVVYIETILKHVSEKSIASIAIIDITDMPAEVASITNNVKEVLKKMEQENLWVMPVIDYSGAYVGLVSKTNIFNKYRAMLSRQN
ncbi:chloride channel protein [Pedobacter xixiisoli]|uniref:Chloride channel protein, CIC family n=1 Tax=Pedobacter xixiisoli TaxID=1476464 RepID=A0A285ZRR3_9SPHI|nr:chloride channel protein [Pedobacter xixiisoli]SOD12343.1 chloride channel protein, CIC family [Pedobacter xixiisoli]